ncbi:MAG: shikimate kinase [Bacteroidetes bacterium]|nr:shikimate kinase [Bacteroidota bacterium]
MKIFLVGLPGCGKTTLGKQIAEKLNLVFIDLDLEIEKTETKTVQQIFSESGESAFRVIESKTLKELCLSKTDFVMATGGGAACFFDNMATMNQAGKTIFIHVPVDEIILRLNKQNLEERPMFRNLNPQQLKEKLELLLSERITFYQKAQLKFMGTKISAEEIVHSLKD